MAARDAARPAGESIRRFISDLASRGLSETTCRIRRRFLQEYLEHAQDAAGKSPLSGAALMEQRRADSWLADAAAGLTRTRTAMRGRQAAAYPNSMRVRTDTYNAFAGFLGLPGRRDTQPPADGWRLTPGDTRRLLHDLAVRRPSYASAITALRTAAVAALVADTGLMVPDLAPLSVADLHLGASPHVSLADGPCPLSGATVQILQRWLEARAVIIAGLEGTDPGHLWIPTKPGRPRGGREPVKPGLTPAAVRTLHAAHRNLVSHVLGAPLRPGALREATPPPAPGPQQPEPAAPGEQG